MEEVIKALASNPIGAAFVALAMALYVIYKLVMRGMDRERAKEPLSHDCDKAFRARFEEHAKKVHFLMGEVSVLKYDSGRLRELEEKMETREREAVDLQLQVGRIEAMVTSVKERSDETAARVETIQQNLRVDFAGVYDRLNTEFAGVRTLIGDLFRQGMKGGGA